LTKKFQNTIILFLSYAHFDLYQLPDDPPPPDEPPPPEKLDPELNELPELHDPPEPPDEKLNPPIFAFPLVRKSIFAFLYQWVCLSVNFINGKATR
jgi:hypothetical protein